MATNSLKRKRATGVNDINSEALTGSDDDRDGYESLTTKKKRPLRKRSEGNTKWLPQAFSDPVEGSSISLNRGHGSVRHNGRGHECVSPPSSLERVSREGLNDVVGGWTASAGFSRPNNGVAPELSKAISLHNDLEEEVRRLREELVDSRRKCEREVRQVRQDMFLDMMVMKDAGKRILRNLHIEQARSRDLDGELRQLQTHHKQRVAELELQITAQKDKLTQQAAEGYIIQLAAEHKDTVISTLEGDLDELRQIENEDRTRHIRERQSQELPPAYGSLDQEDQLLLPDTEEDSGVIEVAIFKRTFRTGFLEIIVQEIANVQKRRRTASYPPEASVGLCFLSLTEALALAATKVDDVLQRSRDVITTHIQEHLDTSRKSDHISQIGRNDDGHVASSFLGTQGCLTIDKLGPIDYKTKRTIRKEVGRHCFIADRFAKLILELTLRLLSTVEIFATDFDLVINYNRRHSVNAELNWTRIDQSLLQALRVALNGGGRSTDGISRSIKIQNYVTWVQMLSDRLQSYKTKLGLNRFFCQSWQWLNEQLDSNRRDIYSDGSLLEELLEMAAARLNPLDQSCLRRYNRRRPADSDALNSNPPAPPSDMIASFWTEEDQQQLNEMHQRTTWAIEQPFMAEMVESEELRQSEDRQGVLREGSAVSSRPSRPDSGEDTE